MSRRTPKERVLRRWPKAQSHRWPDGWTIYSNELVNVNLSGLFNTPQQAWRKAASFWRCR